MLWSSNTMVTWCKELTYWKRPWCWERVRARGEGCYRGLGGWTASLTPWMWVWANSGNSGRQGSLAWYSSWCGKEWTWLSNWTATSEATIIKTAWPWWNDRHVKWSAEQNGEFRRTSVHVWSLDISQWSKSNSMTRKKKSVINSVGTTGYPWRKRKR